MNNSFSISPKAKRNLIRIIPFSVIWLLNGYVFLLVEYLATDGRNVKPDSDITLDFGILTFASIGLVFVGLCVGSLELFVLQKPFRKTGFAQKIVIKTLIYLGMMLIVILITYPIAASLEFDISVFDERVWDKWMIFLNSSTFLSTLMQMFFSILLSVIYAGISENLGHSVLVNMFSGKYHRPVEENRIFMFLDMKNSTAIAEKLGHIEYFKLLDAYYNELSDAIIKHYGQVYQYIGDEIVITWAIDKGVEKSHCIQCFFDMKKDLESKSEKFASKFGVVPEFRAGIHAGHVTTGEIGALKKEIFYTGDVLNTAARIQSLTKEHNVNILISSILYDLLKVEKGFNYESKGLVNLKGKERSIGLYSVDEIPNN